MSLNKFPRVPYAKTIHDQEEINAVVGVLKTSTQMGPKTKEFEDKVEEIYGHTFGIGNNSGSSSLYIAMKVLNLPKGSEVITPVLTFATTIGCIVKSGCIPAFIDSESSQKFIIDVNKIEKMINKKIDPEGYPVADRVMSRGILIACHHGLNDSMIEHIYSSFKEFIKKYL